MKIGELAKQSGVTAETIRYYEKQNLLPAPERLGNNYRVYYQKHLERLRFIKNCRALNMTHEEIHLLLAQMAHPENNCHEINVILNDHLTHVNQRIQELTTLRTQLVELQKTCEENHSADQCTILKGLRTLDLPAEKHSHLS